MPSAASLFLLWPWYRWYRGSSFQTLTVAHIREYILKCGVKPPPLIKKSGLQSLLRQMAPGIGRDTDSEVEGGTTNAAGTEIAAGTGEAVVDEKTA